MTNEEVAKRIDGLKNRCERLARTVNYETWCKDAEACEAALSAIRAATANIDLDAWKECPWCKAEYTIIDDDFGQPVHPNMVKFCWSCGRPLTPEARAMLEKRLRGLECEV